MSLSVCVCLGGLEKFAQIYVLNFAHTKGKKRSASRKYVNYSLCFGGKFVFFCCFISSRGRDPHTYEPPGRPRRRTEEGVHNRPGVEFMNLWGIPIGNWIYLPPKFASYLCNLRWINQEGRWWWWPGCHCWVRSWSCCCPVGWYGRTTKIPGTFTTSSPAAEEVRAAVHSITSGITGVS